jgi:hypothetical protein
MTTLTSMSTMIGRNVIKLTIMKQKMVQWVTTTTTTMVLETKRITLTTKRRLPKKRNS